jgi:inosine-uridine nucleoside N-ribohydrolase
MKKQVWLDCDPGLDDIMAIILAACDDRINLIGVSTSPGNSSLENTSRNALDVLYNIGKYNVQVIMGSPKPFSHTLVYSDNIHGENGLGGLEIPRSPAKLICEDRFGAIYNRIIKA